MKLERDMSEPVLMLLDPSSDWENFYQGDLTMDGKLALNLN